MISDVIKPGDKIDINFLHQKNGKTYKSSVFDFITETELEIAMPTESGKMVLFQVGVACQMYFYTQKHIIYTCEAVVKERYKRDNFYLLKIKITTVPKRFQRRDYFRIDCSMEFTYYPVDKSVVELETTEDIFEEISNLDYILKQKTAITLDLSGGGVRFITDEMLEPESYIVTVIRLTNQKVDKTFYLATELIACAKKENVPDKYVARAKFLFKDPKDRELIIRYVFEEDRCIRKKENG